MPYLIPSDWNGENWACYRLEWPNSPEWNELLRGILSMLSRGRNWDRKSGSIIGAQSIGWEIWERNYPLGQIPCDGTGIIKPIEISGSGVTIIGEDDMGQVVTDVTIEDGILYVWFGKCCKQMVGVIAVDPGPQIVEIDPTEPSTWPCNKARGIADIFTALMITGTDALAPGASLGTNVDLWTEALPAYIFQSSWLRGAISNFLEDAFEIELVIQAANFNDQLACLWEGVLEPTNSLDNAEFDAMQSAIVILGQEASSYISTVMQSFGLAQFANWASAYHQVLGDCTCPEPIDYEGLVHFTGLFTADTPGEFEVVAHNNGKYIDVTWTAPTGTFISEDNFKPGLLCDSAVTEIGLEYKPLDASNFPTDNWVPEVSCPAVVSMWTRIWPDLIALPAVVFNEFAASIISISNFGSPLSPTFVNAPVRKCGGGDDVPQEIYNFRVTIYSVDGVPT